MATSTLPISSFAATNAALKPTPIPLIPITPTSPTSPTKPSLVKSLSTLTCRACAALSMGDPRYYSHFKRASSPGAQKIVVPGRSSTGSYAPVHDHYSGYPQNARDEYRHGSVSGASVAPRKTGGVIPISTEVIYKDGSSSSSAGTGSRDPYSGRPRRLSDADSRTPALRSRPAIVQTAAIPRAPSPVIRGAYDLRDTAFVKPNVSTRRAEPKTKLYSVGGNDSAKLVAESEPYRDSRGEYPRRERAGYHLTGQSQRPRDVDDSAWSYTDPAGMYNDTEPIRHHKRRGSVDRGNARRPASYIEPAGYYPNHRGSKDYGPPPTNRQFNKITDIGRSSSVRDKPTRASSRDRQGTYDSYGDPSGQPLPLRAATTMPVALHQAPPLRRNSRDDGYYRDDDYDDPREPRRPTRQFIDDAAPLRGFGVRAGSRDAYGSSANSSVEPPRPRQLDRGNDVYPASSAAYLNEPLLKMPSKSDYLPPVGDDDRMALVPRREREWERDERPKERDYEREYERDVKPKDRDYERDYERDTKPTQRAFERDVKPKEREFDREPKPKDRDYDRESKPKDRDYDRERPKERDREYESSRPKERDYDRPREREQDSGRHHHRRYSRDVSETRSGAGTHDGHSVRDKAVPAAAAAVGVGGLAAGAAALEKHRHERKQDSDDERTRSSRAPPPPPKDHEEDERSRQFRAPPPPSEREREREDEEPRARRSRAATIDREDERSVRPPRAEPNEREDKREQRYTEKDREEPKKTPAKAEELTPEEFYRRSVQQASAEMGLTRQTSRDEDRSDSDRERRKGDREGRTRRESLTRGAPIERRRGSDEDKIAPKDVRSRPQDLDHDDEVANAQHNRLPNDRAITGGGFTQEPDDIPGSWPREQPQPTAGGSRAPPPPGPPSTELSIPDQVPRSKSADPTADRERRVTIVEPSKNKELALAEAPKVKGILRKPTEKFPEHPDTIREGVTPLKDRLKKDSGSKDIPEGAKWTKIDRRLVNPESLEEKGERFEERENCVIVLRVLTKDEIQGFANRTAEIREEREEKYEKETKDSKRRSHHKNRDDDTTDDERDYKHASSSSRRHRDEDRDRDEKARDERSERPRDRDGDRDRDYDKARDRDTEKPRDRAREHRSSRSYDDDYSSENDAARGAIVDDGAAGAGRSRRGSKREDREREDEYMSGGIGR